MAAEAVLTFATEGILKKVLSLAAQPFSLAWGFKAELGKLQESFTNIELLLNDVADKPQGRPIEAWVKKLKDVAHDAEDVFDELEYEGYRRKVEIQNHMKKKVLNFFSLSNPLAFRLQMAHKIQKINASLVDLERKASPLGLASKNKVATTQGIRCDRQTNAFFGKDEITVGRKDDVSKIVTTLTDSKYNQENLAVMAIVGMGGLGKTTLAKSVYNEDSIDKFFEKKIWICVSDTFDVNSILHQMSEQLNREKAPSKDNQNTLLLSLNEELKDKKYLLVLDDVWNEDSKLWESFMECLSKLSSAKGSKIIVTTRKEKVASISEKILPRHELGKLSGDECWSIMRNRAFPTSSDPKFDTIGREIAEKCRGVPLVAKVLGGILHTKKSIREWPSFKNNTIWDNLSKEEDIIMPVLRLSFDNLESPSLKQCFAYCSIFEKDFEIQRENLIQLWMAQGLLRASHDESKDMEDTGNEYFDILLHSSLFQDATISDNGTVSKCKMHDLVHDLAELVSKSESLKGDLCGRDNTLEIRHVARVSTSTLENIPARSARKLRSLFSDNGEVPTNILPQFKALRVLNLWNANIEELPVSVGRLKHLRYLDISETGFKALPKSIGKLYNLQTLRAVNCALEEFPKELQNLINLRHIYFDEDIKFPKGIRRLTCLRTLPYFSVGNEIGRRIEELASLKQLKGELIVSNLQLVKNGEEAKKAKLEDKTKIRHLSFNWTEDRSTTDNNEDEDVLEGLRPHLELESLSIANFMGNKFPPWMMSGSLPLNNLKRIQLLGCDKCEGVPPLGHLPSLTELKIRGMANLKCVGDEFYGYDLVHNLATTSEEVITLFPALKVLYISDCGDLNEWKQAPTTSRKKVVVFPCLEMLTVENCSKLRNAPSHFPCLQKLEMSSCDSRTPIEEISSGLTTLTSLEIRGIKELTCLPRGILKKNNNLYSLVIKKCDDLTCITPDVVGSRGSLKKLVIWNCDKLRHLPDGLDTLQLLEELTIKGCDSLELIPIAQGMASLRELEIGGCGRLSLLPSGLKNCTSLQKLSITHCDGLSGPLSLWASLVEVSLMNCDGLSGRLSVWASLVELDMRYCNNLTSIEMKGNGSLTASLQNLIIWNCHELSSIPALPQQCPSLQYLEIIGCPKLSWVGVQSSRVEKEEKCISLQSTSDLRTMTSLQQLFIINCERLESWVSSLQFPLSLDTLSIVKIPNLQILPSLDSLNSLRDLGIGGFWEELDSFPDFEVGSLMHLRSLSLSGWPKLKSLPQQIQHLTSLTGLFVYDFEGVETLPEWLGSLTSLTYLWIWGCKNLKNLPSVQAMQRLTKLQTLGIRGCHPLLEQRCTKNCGTDWPKISHIPDITIGEGDFF
nr:putative disease resistance protein RGA1 isoform X2 [Malus domestica]XP_028943876.1 putative disease resistance protein RGA1 isoform X2 [Malus domestica]XP_028943877.1 putative disease resistance protein RGA1 isoform X2 [Malus domestica]XP_028943878.1 putative disease resistance protein RGA1 isoform X2 [Malus domestica]XP_028943879.1 putative disease resistance protein RGA1 isoform X2 [Malus domestica]XP_028943880.1 putative disease resistance protein RGA1 isoform X2 [Malus domestica]XP_02